MLVWTSLEGWKGHLEDEGIISSRLKSRLRIRKVNLIFKVVQLSTLPMHIYTRFPFQPPHPYSRLFSPDGLKRERQLPMKRNISDFLPSNKSCGALKWDSLALFQDPSQSFIANAPTNAFPYSPTHEQ